MHIPVGPAVKHTLTTLALACASAYADVALDTATPTFVLFRGTTAVGGTLASLEACQGAARVDAETRKTNGGYRCVGTYPIQTIYTAPPPPPAANWTRIAIEWQAFTVAANSTVRYGAGTSFMTRTLSGTGQCTNAYFGNDPAPGVSKACYVASGAPAPAPSPSPAPGPSPAPAPASNMPFVDLAKIPARATGVSGPQFRATTEQPVYLDGTGNFRTVCGYSHMATDDPIVYPGQPGASHLHTFFGNTGTTAFSTPESIRNFGNSTCRGGTVNRTAYWVPALIDTRTGTPQRPLDSHWYYKSGYNLSPQSIRAFPAGLRIIAGNGSATGPNDIAKWGCHNAPDEAWKQSIPSCPVGSELWQNIHFPQCWDGVNLDSRDHKSHMAYPVGNACPSTHPVALPEITLNAVYAVTEANSGNWLRLSSDMYPASLPGGYSSHADWVNGWDQSHVDIWVARCIVAALDCHSHLRGDGFAYY